MDDRSHLPACPHDAVVAFIDGVNTQLWRSNALMIGNAVLVASMVVVNAIGWRYRHATVTRFLSLGASTLYLPIVSYVVSSIGTQHCKAAGIEVDCFDLRYVIMLLMWTVLVQCVGINFSAVVAVNDGDGQKLGPSIELLARTLWTSYLVFYYYNRGYVTDPSFHGPGGISLLSKPLIVELILLCVLGVVKITLKLYASEKARRSFALGRNARLVAGYMEQLHGQPPADEPIAPFILMGEEKQHIEESPHGYIMNRAITDNNSLVTVDRVWRLASTGDVLLARRPQLTDLCLSFALFKLLRCRFARCNLVESGSNKAFNFVQDVLLSHGDPDRVFRVIADEVSFLGDSYYSSLPAFNIGRTLSVLNIIISLSIIITCCFAAVKIGGRYMDSGGRQISCFASSCTLWNFYGYRYDYIEFGPLLLNSSPTMFLLIAAILAEAWEIASYIFSDWVKVTLICSYVSHASWQQSLCVHKCLGLAFKFRIMCMKSWRDQMGQISLLSYPKSKICGLIQNLSCFPFRMRVQHVKVPTEVKAAIVGALTRSNGSLSNGAVVLQNSRIGNGVLWGESTCDVILVWHIATGIFETRHTASSTSSSSADRTVATYLSRYCVYLMEAAPELLPDDKEWTKKRHKTVREDLDQLLSAWSHLSGGYDRMIELLSERSGDQDDVVKNGVRLGKQLVAEPDAEAVWGALARLWAEMILYVAPSDNLKAHKETIARGGELVTLIWALLTNAGIITRPRSRTAT